MSRAQAPPARLRPAAGNCHTCKSFSFLFVGLVGLQFQGPPSATFAWGLVDAAYPAAFDPNLPAPGMLSRLADFKLAAGAAAGSCSLPPRCPLSSRDAVGVAFGRTHTRPAYRRRLHFCRRPRRKALSSVSGCPCRSGEDLALSAAIGFVERYPACPGILLVAQGRILPGRLSPVGCPMGRCPAYLGVLPAVLVRV